MARQRSTGRDWAVKASPERAKSWHTFRVDLKLTYIYNRRQPCDTYRPMRNSVSVDYSKLVPGQEISRQTYILDDDVVSKYVDAVSDESSVESADGS